MANVPHVFAGEIPVVHPHPMLGRTVFIELEDVQVEHGVFIDSEHGLATALLVGRCRICGVVYMPLIPILPHDDITPPITTTTPLPQQSLWRTLYEQ
jgi:hypothetical protein